MTFMDNFKGQIWQSRPVVGNPERRMEGLAREHVFAGVESCRLP